MIQLVDRRAIRPRQPVRACVHPTREYDELADALRRGLLSQIIEETYPQRDVVGSLLVIRVVSLGQRERGPSFLARQARSEGIGNEMIRAFGLAGALRCRPSSGLDH